MDNTTLKNDKVGDHILEQKSGMEISDNHNQKFTTVTVGNKKHNYIITEEGNDDKTLDSTNFSLKTSDLEYVCVKFKPNYKDAQKKFPQDSNIVTKFFKTIKGKKQECLYYKGHSYTYSPYHKNTFLCARSITCRAGLKINQEKNGVCEMGLHKCGKTNQISKRGRFVSEATGVTYQPEDIVKGIKLESYNMELDTENKFEQESDSTEVTLEYPDMRVTEFESCINGNNILEQESEMEMSESWNQNCATARMSSTVVKDAPGDSTDTNHVSSSVKNSSSEYLPVHFVTNQQCLSGGNILDLGKAMEICDNNLSNQITPNFFPTIKEVLTSTKIQHNKNSLSTPDFVKIESSRSFDTEIEQKSQENLLLDNAVQNLVDLDPDNLKMYEMDSKVAQIEPKHLLGGDSKGKLASFQGVVGTIYFCNDLSNNSDSESSNTMVDKDTPIIGPSLCVKEFKRRVTPPFFIKSKYGDNFVEIKKVINLLCNSNNIVPLEEQTAYEIINSPTDETEHVNSPMIKFRGHLHRNKAKYAKIATTTYICVKTEDTKCTGTVSFKNYKVFKYREHFCLGRNEKRFSDLDLSKEYHSIILYFNVESNCSELLYQNYTYWKIVEASDGLGGFIWECTNFDCSGRLKVFNTFVSILHDHNCIPTSSTRLQITEGDKIHRVSTVLQNEIPSKLLAFHEEETNAQCTPQEGTKRSSLVRNLCRKIKPNKQENNTFVNEIQIKREKLLHGTEENPDFNTIDFAKNACKNDDVSENVDKASKEPIAKILFFKKEYADVVDDDSIEYNLNDEDD